MTLPNIATYAQADSKVQTIEAKSVPEVGCPVGLDSSEAELEIDPFNAVVAIRIYLNYRNNSSQQLAAVKFRVRFLDEQGETCGNFQAEDARSVSPGGSGSQKWRKEGINPRTRSILVRVLQAKFADATTWNSEKLQSPGDVTAGSSDTTPPSVTPPTAETPPASSSEPSTGADDLKPKMDDPFSK
jgi:hypothetical protein